MTVYAHFKNLSLTRFLEEIEWQNYFWIVKRLSGNDTSLTGGHQYGLYLPRIFFFETVDSNVQLEPGIEVLFVFYREIG